MASIPLTNENGGRTVGSRDFDQLSVDGQRGGPETGRFAYKVKRLTEAIIQLIRAWGFIEEENGRNSNLPPVHEQPEPVDSGQLPTKRIRREKSKCCKLFWGIGIVTLILGLTGFAVVNQFLIKKEKNPDDYLIVKERKNRDDAENYCNSKGMSLVAIESEDENNLLIKEILKVYGFNQPLYLWTSGIQDPLDESKWKWGQTGIPWKAHTDNIWTNWGRNQPDNWDGTQNCLIIWNTHGRTPVGIWDDNRCSVPFHFVCEREFGL